MLEVRFVADYDYGQVWISVLFQFLYPFVEVLKRRYLGDVVNQDGTQGSAVVGACDGSVPLLAWEEKRLSYSTASERLLSVRLTGSIIACLSYTIDVTCYIRCQNGSV